MLVLSTWSAARTLFPILSLLALVITGPALAAESLDLFAALDAGEIEVTAIPRYATRLNLQIKNRTERPLTIQLPAGFAAVPVLAQFQPFGQQGNQQNGGGQAQQLGAGNNPAGNQQGPFNNPGIFNIPAGKVIKLKLPCVCLEHGKPTPNSRMTYAVRPLASVVSAPEVASTLAAMSRGDITRRVAQLAAWHYANDKSWTDLAAQRTQHIGGFSEPMYSAEEIAKARKFAETLAPEQYSTSTPK